MTYDNSTTSSVDDEIKQQKKDQKILPPIAAIVGFILSATIGYQVKGYFDRAQVEIEISQMEFAGLSQDTDTFETPDFVIEAYRRVPATMDNFSNDMTLTDISQIVGESISYSVSLESSIKKTNEIVEILASGEGECSNAESEKIEEIAASVDGSIFQVTVTYVLRTENLIREIVDTVETDELYKYRFHPENLLDPILARDHSKFWDLSFIESPDDATSRQRYEDFASNVFKRLFIYCDRDFFSRVLKLVMDDHRKDLAEFSTFDEALESWTREIDPDRVRAQIYISNRGQRAASLDPSLIIALSVGDLSIELDAFLVTLGGKEILDPVVLEPNSTLKFRAFSEHDVASLSVRDGVTLDDLKALAAAQVIEGRLGAFVRSASGSKVVTNVNAFSMGASTVQDQKSKIVEALK